MESRETRLEGWRRLGNGGRSFLWRWSSLRNPGENRSSRHAPRIAREIASPSGRAASGQPPAGAQLLGPGRAPNRPRSPAGALACSGPRGRNGAEPTAVRGRMWLRCRGSHRRSAGRTPSRAVPERSPPALRASPTLLLSDEGVRGLAHRRARAQRGHPGLGAACRLGAGDRGRGLPVHRLSILLALLAHRHTIGPSFRRRARPTGANGGSLALRGPSRVPAVGFNRGLTGPIRGERPERRRRALTVTEQPGFLLGSHVAVVSSSRLSRQAPAPCARSRWGAGAAQTT